MRWSSRIVASCGVVLRRSAVLGCLRMGVAIWTVGSIARWGWSARCGGVAASVWGACLVGFRLYGGCVDGLGGCCG